jgi:hypothetical protein
MIRASAQLSAMVAALAMSGCAGRPNALQDPSPNAHSGSTCRIDTAAAWITGWLTSWEFTSKVVLDLNEAVPPEIVFYDTSCVYTTSAVTAGAAGIAGGPVLHGRKLPWRVLSHHGIITLPDSSQMPVQLASFAAPMGAVGAFLVMAAPEIWAVQGIDSDSFGRDRLLTAVFLHEFAHTLQIPSFQDIIGPIDKNWGFPEELTDDVVQERFGADSAYVAAYEAERDLLHRAAAAEAMDDVRSLATEALAMMRARQVRWFTDELEVFGVLDDAFLSFEGAGQWVGYAWLIHPRGGGVRPDAALAGMRRGGRKWTQDEGLALFLVLDRLLPGWPSRVFGQHQAGATELLTAAVGAGSDRNH